jgi:hypothetical protein
MGPLPILKVDMEASKIRADRIRMKQEQQDMQKEVLGRLVYLWWCLSHSRSWVRGAVHGN